MKSEVTLRRRSIGTGQAPFITAECGVTCNYDVDMAKELIDVVAESGADAIKFIFWFPEEIMSDREVVYTYDTLDGPQAENMYEMLDKLRFSMSEWRSLKQHADQLGVTMFATVNSPTGAVWAEELGLEAFKLSSWDFNYLPLWRDIAKTGKPVIVDTGPVNLQELAACVQVLCEAGNDQLVLVHCFHSQDVRSANMLTIPYLRRTFRCPVGYSSPGRDDDLDIVAVSIGASFVEKRLTMSRRLPGHHHVLSKEPAEFKAYVDRIRSTHQSLGDLQLRPSQEDLQERKKWFRHLVAAEDISEGTTLTGEMLASKRGEEGVSPWHVDLFVSRRVRRSLRRNEPFHWDDLLPAGEK